MARILEIFSEKRNNRKKLENIHEEPEKISEWRPRKNFEINCRKFALEMAATILEEITARVSKNM